MTYFNFLLLFIVAPTLLLFAWNAWSDRRGRPLPAWLHAAPPRIVVGLHLVIALVYTTPWDNYLVATRVWWYDPALVTGITIGWVPIEEYTFFLLHPIFVSAWLFWLARRIAPRRPALDRPAIRHGAVAVTAVLWLAATALLISGWKPGTYLALIFSWALIPVIIQLAFGADILWRHRELVGGAILSATFYLGLADTLAIASGTWTIDPEQSLPLLLGGILPIEELLFFFIITVLVIFGVTLALAEESKPRLLAWKGRLKR